MKQVECKATSNEEENVIFYFRRKNEKREDTQCEDRRKKREVEWWGEECGGRGGKITEREGPGLHIEELQNFNTEKSRRGGR